jgi:hypothetical protein
LLPVENPGYIFVRESAATMEENYKSFHQEEGIIVVQAIIDNLFEEALGFRVSSEHGGGHGTTEEERHSSSRCDEGHTKLVYEVHQTSRTYGGAARPTSPLNTIIPPPPYAPWYSEGFVIMTEEEENKLARLERLVANVDFDDQALHILGFHMGHQG